MDAAGNKSKGHHFNKHNVLGGCELRLILSMAVQFNGRNWENNDMVVAFLGRPLNCTIVCDGMHIGKNVARIATCVT
jgi:hypothetical protein